MLSDTVKKDIKHFENHPMFSSYGFNPMVFVKEELEELLPQIESQEKLMEEMFEIVKETKVTDIKSIEQHDRLMSIVQKYRELKESI